MELVVCTKRGFILRGTSFSHCLHFVVVALANKGTPQLLELLISRESKLESLTIRYRASCCVGRVSLGSTRR